MFWIDYIHEDNKRHLAEIDAPPPLTRATARRERETEIYWDGFEAAENGWPFANPYCAITQPRSYTAWGYGFLDRQAATPAA